MAKDKDFSLKICTWNINSVNARIDHVIKWIDANDPDIVLLQETKCEEIKFPFAQLEKYNFNIITSGQKSYNGVAILSKYMLEDIRTTFADNPCSHEARFIEASCETSIGFLKVMSVYVPNGSHVRDPKFQIKMDFYDALQKYLTQEIHHDQKIILGGDLNVAPYDVDVYSPSALENSIGFSINERIKLRSILNSQFLDLYRISKPNSHEFSWWDYRSGGLQKNHGMRIDFLLGNPMIVDTLVDCYIDKEPRYTERPSDHVPVVATFKKI